MSYIHQAQAEEKIGRWEDRCDAMRADSGALSTWVEVCDRPRDHRGLHRGRRFIVQTKSVTAYVAWPR